MKKQLTALIVFMFICSLALLAQDKAKITSTTTKEQQSDLSPLKALEKLKEGNERFLKGIMRKRDWRAQIASSAKQFPFAVILNCMDSRGAPEIIFDQGIGDIFVERLAGNVVNADVLGGMEFGAKLAGAKIIVVLGHTTCGAVKGACENAQLGNLTELLQKIRPAVLTVQKSDNDVKKSCDDHKVIDKMAEQNVRNMVAKIKEQSPVIEQLIKEGKVGIIGGMHDLSTGKVKFFDDIGVIPTARP